MFTEPPAAPPQPPAQIAPAATQTQSAVASPAPTANVAPPEVLPSQAPAIAPEPTPSPSAPAEASAPVSPAKPAPSQPIPALQPTPPPSEPTAQKASPAAIAQRRAEVEAILLNLTRKSHAAQKEKAELQAATAAAKYTKAGDFAAARQVVNQPALAEAIRKSLLVNIQQQELAQTGKAPAPQATSPTRAAVGGGGVPAVGRIAAPESFGNARYATAPIMPFNTAELRDRLSRLVGRGLLNYIYPLTLPAPVTSNFGWRIHPISGDSRFHRGIDLGAPYGSPVVSAKAGVIETAGDMDGYGLTVVVRHKDGQQTLYAHLSGIYVQPGETVKQGQLIGLVGSTGNSTGPHLHFELHELTPEGWTALDPAVVLEAAIAFAKNPPLPSRKPQAFNLAASGLLDLNLPSPGLAPAVPVLSGLLEPTAANSAELLVPFTVLPTALPEIGWMVTPVVETLLSDELARSPLDTDEAPLPPVSFSAVAALDGAMDKPADDTVAFKPMKTAITAPTTLEFAATPLAQLIASVTQPIAFPLDLRLLEAVQGGRQPQAPAGRAVTFPPVQPPQVSDRRLVRPQPTALTQRN